MTMAPSPGVSASLDRFLRDAEVLSVAARERAAEKDALSAVVLTWGADLALAKAVAWEDESGSATPSVRTLLRWADAALRPGAAADVASPVRASDVVLEARRSLRDGCTPAVQRALTAAWPDLDALDVLPAPTSLDVERAVQARLGGDSPAAYVSARRSAARALLLTARERRVAADTSGAIEAAYQADLGTVEAYLVESARAAGDEHLLSVITRWELVTRAIAALSGLPASVIPAVTLLRDAMSAALGPADGERLRREFGDL
jgi:hypothetical protein